jgi:hypothetical protein
MIELINLLASIGGAFLYSLMTFLTFLLLQKETNENFEDSDICWLICICAAWFITLPILLIIYIIRFFIKFYNLFKLEEKVNDLETELKRLKRKK